MFQLKPKTIYRVPRFAYLGAGAKVDELPRWLKFLEGYDWEKYVDLTAGSNNQPYAIHRYFQRDVIVNDVCYYSHVIARAMLMRTARVSDQVIGAALRAGTANIDAKVPGRFTRNTEWDVGPNAERIKYFVDGVAAWATATKIGGNIQVDAAFILACLGSAILKKLTMRSTGLHSIKGKQANGTYAAVSTITHELWRKADEANVCVSLPQNRNLALFGTLREALPRLDAHMDRKDSLYGCIVNVDYAWPYEKNDNPYYDYLDVSDFLGSPLDRASFQYWRDESTETVLEEVTQMTRDILARNPVRFFLWNQSTNRPAPEVVLKHLSKAGGIQAQVCFEVDRITTSGKTTFKDVVLEIAPLRRISRKK